MKKSTRQTAHIERIESPLFGFLGRDERNLLLELDKYITKLAKAFDHSRISLPRDVTEVTVLGRDSQSINNLALALVCALVQAREGDGIIVLNQRPYTYEVKVERTDTPTIERVLAEIERGIGARDITDAQRETLAAFALWCSIQLVNANGGAK